MKTRNLFVIMVIILVCGASLSCQTELEALSPSLADSLEDISFDEDIDLDTDEIGENDEISDKMPNQFTEDDMDFDQTDPDFGTAVGNPVDEFDCDEEEESCDESMQFFPADDNENTKIPFRIKNSNINSYEMIDQKKNLPILRI